MYISFEQENLKKREHFGEQDGRITLKLRQSLPQLFRDNTYRLAITLFFAPK
jgi:hypothetical protein